MTSYGYSGKVQIELNVQSNCAWGMLLLWVTWLNSSTSKKREPDRKSQTDLLSIKQLTDGADRLVGALKS